MSNTLPKKKTAALLLLVVILILGSMLFVNRRTAPKSSFVLEGREKLAVTGEVTAVSSNNSMVHYVKDMLIEAQAENLRVKNIKGSVAWSRKLPAKINRVVHAADNIVTVDSQNNINYYSLQGKLLWTYKAPYEIVDIFTEDSGSILAEYKGMTGSHAEVFSGSGSKLGSISIENAHILSFSTAANAFSISVVDTSAETVKTKIITYNFKGDILWAQNFDNRIIAKLNYAKSGKLTALSENSLYIYKNDGNLQDEVKLDGNVRKAAMSDYITAIVLNNKGKNFLICYDGNIKEQCRVEVAESIAGIHPMKNSLILYSGDELMILTVKGELIARYKSNMDISEVYMTEENKVYIISNRALQQLEYQK